MWAEMAQWHNPQSLVFPEQSRLDNFSSPLAVSEVILQSVLWELCKLSRTHRVEIGNAVRITLQPWPERGESRVTDIQISREAFLVRKLLFIQTLLRFVANSNNTLPQLWLYKLYLASLLRCYNLQQKAPSDYRISSLSQNHVQSQVLCLKVFSHQCMRNVQCTLYIYSNCFLLC